MSPVAPQFANYLGLVRFSHTIFALPFALAAMFLAAMGWPPLRVFLLILAAMVTARNAAMGFNRLVDARIDAKNPRTAGRHLPAGKLSRRGVIVFVAANSFLFCAAAYALNPLAFALSIPTLALIFSYSFAKRFTAACHFILGLCLAISPVGAWIAVRGLVEPTPGLLALALLLWVSGFDMIYATLDVEFDRREGLFSFPARLGIPATLALAAALHAAMVGALLFFGFFEGMNRLYFVGVAAIAAVIAWEHWQARRLDPVSVNRAFFNANAAVSLIFLGVVVQDVFLPPL